ncbi:DUF3127 domain-containing protein [Siphonobacter sp. SORGH_AS_0500]|uniref:DUF3127 domain-containing protein n=1 Tax=Siphonobacter sp. SORGH_AS_0500 TaxID=1864824 RepID=UPI0028617365|nr:DUF3127 domain-containing protein [Siphonobacter sp. SORGH_AS_0500]MDR6195943.1 hypothetical protein [Siphonobacter sp. SORGH_AS_0500]
MADSNSVTGKFLGAGTTREVGQNGFLVRSFWVDITTNPEYPNTPEFQLKGDKVALVDNLTKGQQIKVSYNLNGRKVKGRDGNEIVITNLDAWRIEVINTTSAATINTPKAEPVAAGGDDLPF